MRLQNSAADAGCREKIEKMMAPGFMITSNLSQGKQRLKTFYIARHLVVSALCTYIFHYIKHFTLIQFLPFWRSVISKMFGSDAFSHLCHNNVIHIYKEQLETIDVLLGKWELLNIIILTSN
jgi:hypothetical protein